MVFALVFLFLFQSPSSSTASPNLLSTEQHPGVLDHYLTKELLAQRVAGPFTHPPFQNFSLSPIGVVPKKTPGEFRCILHLLYPYGASVNDGSPVEDFSVTYSRIDNAVGLISSSGVGRFLAKTDIKSAFPIIPIRPANYTIYLVSIGEVITILTDVCPWAWQVPVRLLRPSVQLFSGLPRLT